MAKAGNQVRITAQLINVEDGYHLWSDSYDRELHDIFAIRSQVAQTVAKALQVTLAAGESQTLGQKPTEDLEAYQLYLKGRHAAATYADPVTAMRYLQQAIARDPNYALAYNGLAYYYFSGTDGLFAGSECLPRARQAAEKALQLDPSLAEPHTWLGAVYWWYDRDYAAARREFETAVKMQPDLASARGTYGWYLVAAGQVDEGLSESRRAVELDPLSSETNAFLGVNLYLTRRYDEAVKQLRAAINTDPDYVYAHEFLGRVYARTGRFSEAIEELRTAVKLARGPRSRVGSRPRLCRRGGQEESDRGAQPFTRADARHVRLRCLPGDGAHRAGPGRRGLRGPGGSRGTTLLLCSVVEGRSRARPVAVRPALRSAAEEGGAE